MRYKKIFGDWVSFEVELTKIIRSLDLLVMHLNNREDYLIYLSNGASLYLRILNEVDLMSIINVFPDNKFFNSGVKSATWMNVEPPVVYFIIKGYEFKNEYDIYKAIADFTQSFPKELFNDLNIFSNLFSLYLLIVRDIKNNNISYGAMLNSDYFINYNYTNYLASVIFDKCCHPLDILYINGKIDYSSFDTKSRIVFGIDSNTKLNNIGFEVFTKTVQRSLYSTDIERLSDLLCKNIEEIYIFGHSMNLADYESLSYVFTCAEKNGKPKVNIYCLNDSAKIDIIINLREILGSNKFDDYQRQGYLSFPYSSETITNNNSQEATNI